ncbi:metal ABC transporter substrate-binding protein [Georgenia faecalis]|uniref:Metal ABC transporter substrate-binding protein n=1 Tax=Georgenia faecalis TaxID=2483799 RepID=A0ABV9DAT1_9MICO|nr:metal ABC transporter substrate-binding protein [Georgenia faecalis]
MPNFSLRAAGAVAALAVVALGGCTAPAADAAPEPEDPRPLVLTTFTVLADMAGVVGGDAVRVESITRPGVEVHGYEPTPEDLRRAQGAALVLDNGLGLEAWADDLIERTGAPRVVLTEGIEPIAIGSGASEGEANPHAWMSPRAGQEYVRAIADALAELVPHEAEGVRARAADYSAELGAVHDRLVTEVARLPESARVLVTCEGAFAYLARDAGLREAYLWPVNSDGETSARQVARTIVTVRENDVPAVFCESTVDDRMQRQVADESGAVVGGTLYVDSLSEPDGPVPTYLDLLRHDVDTIVAGLSGASA